MEFTQQQIFTEIYEKGLWNNNNSNIPKSGPGSLVKNALNSIQLLDKIIDEDNSVKSVIDLGCGDLSWIHKSKIFNLDYTGYDIVDSVINENRKKYSNKTFFCKNIITDELKDADIVIIRDVIFHLKIDDILSLFENLTMYNVKYIFLTTCRNTVNDDIFDKYHYHKINVEIQPFKIINHIYKISENVFDRDVILIDFNYFRNLFEPKIKIPKKIHQIWIGPKKIPENYLKYMETWKKYFSNWEYKLWTDSDISSLQIKNIEAYNNSKSYAQKADILRYEIIQKEGGMYVDCDFECLRNFTKEIKDVDFFSGYEVNSPQKPIAIGIFGSVVNHKILNNIVVNVPDNILKNKKQPINIQTGPIFFTKVVNKYLDDNMKIFEPVHFYPYHYNQKKPNTYSTKSYAVHHWGKMW